VAVERVEATAPLPCLSRATSEANVATCTYLLSMAPRAPENQLINPEYFQRSFSVDAFLVSLTRDVIDSTSSAGRSPGEPTGAKESLEKVHKLLRVLERCVSCKVPLLEANPTCRHAIPGPVCQ
jgi:hypothetical protein